MNEELQISKRSKYGYDIVDIRGELSFKELEGVEEFLQANVAEDTKNVILNLAEVPFINSSALALIVKLMQDFGSRGVELFLMNPNETVRGLFEMTGVKKYFKFIKSEESLVEKRKVEDLDDMLEL